jgi:2-methoxy-6-polyprenyl-1,4-benzoquinol methylase
MASRPAALRRALQFSLHHPRPSTFSSSSFIRSFSSTTPSLAAPNPTPDYAIPDPSRPTHFGYETVTESEKRERVAGVFTSVAESYDRMNDLMSFGWHRIWK